MEAILDELKQYNLKRINDISFEHNFTLLNKFYVLVEFDNNIIISLHIARPD